MAAHGSYMLMIDFLYLCKN